MKKFLTLVLALVLALALSVPAMAFTSVTPDEDTPYELDIYLVEHEDDEFFGFVGMPPSDRGYAKNEIVAAIVEFVVPEDEALAADFSKLVLSGDDVTLNVADNKIVDVAAPGTDTATLYTSEGNLVFTYASSKLSYSTLTTFDAAANDDEVTGKVLFFAKVTGDEASLTAKLDAAEEDWVASATYSSMDVLDDYTVTDFGDQFLVEDEDGVELFTIMVNDDDETVDLYIWLDGTDDYLAVNPEAGVFYLGGVREDDKGIIRDLQAIYEDAFVEDFGFDFSIQKGILTRDFFEDLNGSDDIEATVEIKPWTAYVTVPDNIVVDPPKTGDAASIVGFVMIVLAAAAVVAVKKVRA